MAYAFLCVIVIFSLVDFRFAPRSAPIEAFRAEEEAGFDAGWPQLRGPGYDGRSSETELADAWPVKGPPVLWSKEIGAGYSGFIAQGGRVYTETQGLTEQTVLALEADTGQTVWEQGYTWPYQPGAMFPGPRATPTWSGGRIYFAAPNGLVGCMNAGDGRPLWSVNVLQQFKGLGITFGYACSPVVEDGKVFLPVGGPSVSVVALDADTGAIRWGSGSAPASYSSVLPITFHGRRQVVALLQNKLAGFDLQTGRLLWEQDYAKGYDEHAAALLYDEPYLRTMQAYRAGSDLYVLEAGGPEETKDGVPACRIKRVRHDAQVSNDVASSVLVDGFVYGFDLRGMQASRGAASRGSFRCMDFKTGAVRWSSDRPGQASIVVADGKLLMLNDSGQVLLVRANPKQYEELGRADVFPGETCWTAPALHRGRLYLRSPTRAACLFVGKPERMTTRQRALAAPPAAIAKVAPTNLSWLLGAERENPFEMPDLRELLGWYLFSLGALVATGVLAGASHAMSRFCCSRWPGMVSKVVFWSGVVVLGIIVTPLANRYSRQFVFTWPLSLIAVHQIALAAVSWSKQTGQSKRIDWMGIAGAGGLVLTCVLYFKLTRHLSLAPAWYFLLVLPVSWPIAVPAARRLFRGGRLPGDILWLCAVFSVYFWAAGGVMLFRTSRL
jgi:outer membrane protein assembly factor BamB